MIIKKAEVISYIFGKEMTLYLHVQDHLKLDN